MPPLEHNWDINPCNLQPRNLKKLKWRYVARQGLGVFPTDMLRYDRAIVIWQEEVDRVHNIPIYEYTIVGETKPTVGRWESFMYCIVTEPEPWVS